MIKKALLGTGILIGLYLLISHATDAGSLLKVGGQTYALGVKTLQGR